MLMIAETLKLAAAAAALVWVVAVIAMPRRRTLHVAWAIFCVSLATVLLREVFGEALGPWTRIFALAGGGTCSCFWLVARSLFRARAPVGLAELVLVGGIFAPTAIDQIVYVFSLGSVFGDARIDAFTLGLDRVQTLLSSTVLVLSFWEGVRGWSSALPANEQRLRALYLATFGLAASTCTLILDHGAATALPAGVTATIQAVAAAAILGVTSIAVIYRTRHALPAEPVGGETPARRNPAPADPTPEDVCLGHRIRRAVGEDRLYLDPELRISSLARRLREPDYRLSRAITAGLGEANFNRFVNRFRVDHAQAMLRDPACRDLSILAIALDSGFASIGPFNRAFKAEAGVTPRDYRAQAAPPPLASAAGSPHRPSAV